MNRRGFLGGLLAMPAIIRTPGLLMAVRTSRFVTLMDLARRLPADHDINQIADMLSEENDIMRTITWTPVPNAIGYKIYAKTPDGRLLDPAKLVFVQT